MCSSNSMAVSFMLPQVMVTEKEHVSLITAGRNVPCSSRVYSSSSESDDEQSCNQFYLKTCEN